MSLRSALPLPTPEHATIRPPTCRMSPTPPIVTSTPAVAASGFAACAARIWLTISAESRPAWDGHKGRLQALARAQVRWAAQGRQVLLRAALLRAARSAQLAQAAARQGCRRHSTLSGSLKPCQPASKGTALLTRVVTDDGGYLAQRARKCGHCQRLLAGGARRQVIHNTCHLRGKEMRGGL